MVSATNRANWHRCFLTAASNQDVKTQQNTWELPVLHGRRPGARVLSHSLILDHVNRLNSVSGSDMPSSDLFRDTALS